MNGFYSKEELKALNLGYCGKHVLLSKNTSIYNPSGLHLDDHCRVDDFCLISPGTGGIYIGKHVHIAAYVLLKGKGEICFEDYAAASARVSIFSSNDDYSGNYMMGPTFPIEFTNMSHGDVILKRLVCLGAGSVVLPGVVCEEGSATAAMTFVAKNLAPYTIYGGVPARPLKERSRNMADLLAKFLHQHSMHP